MTTADYALIVSLLSLVVSLGSLGWSVWSKFIHPKPKIQIRFMVMNLIAAGEVSAPFLAIYATNFGPTDTTLKIAECRCRKKGWRHIFRDRWQWAVWNTADSPEAAIERRLPFRSGLPSKLPVGGEFGAYLVFDHAGLKEHDVLDVGMVDVFGRHHWAPRNQVRQVRARVRAGDAA